MSILWQEELPCTDNCLYMTLPNAPRHRINSIDLLRGIIMVIMALDHTRDYFHITASTDSPTNLATTTPFLFFTRWITHFCAPSFVFLAGTSAYLLGLKKTKKELSAFLIKRGLWLVLAEILIVTLAWTFNPFYNLLILQVIWAIGISMILLGVLVSLPYSVLLAIGLVIAFGHNLLDYPEAARNGKVGFWWDLMHHAFFSPYPIFSNHTVFVVYAFLPWTGIMLLGFCFGRLFESRFSPAQRKRLLLVIGSGAIVLFIMLRLINAYGDPAHWSVQRNATYTLLSFLNVTKYPPSLMFICMTLGPAIVLLALLENANNGMSNVFRVYGRVPFFYYVLHLYLIHLLTVTAFFLSGYGAHDIIPRSTPFFFRPDHFGYSLLAVYGVWLLVLIILYPLCRWYNRYKSVHHQWWLSYL